MPPRRHPEPGVVAAWGAFCVAWDHFNGPPATPEVWDNPRPENWRGSVGAYHRLGVSDEQVAEAVRLAFEREGVPRDAKFAYICGILKNYAKVSEAKGDKPAARGRS